MTAPGSQIRLLVLVLLASGLAGCHAVDFYQPVMQQPVPPALEPPRELSMMSLPTYRVEPPDLLTIEMLKLVPRPPYRIDIYDVLQIRVMGTLPNQPIDGFFLVEAEGIVTLGPAYGTVRVAGMTIEEATRAITKQLQGVLVESGRVGAVGQDGRHGPGERRLHRRARRHDQSQGIRHAVRGRQDGDRDSAGLAEAPANSISTRRRRPSRCGSTTARCFT